MATGITNSQGWTILRQLAASVNASGEVSDAVVKEIMDKADTNNDGVITEDEFVTAFEKSDLWETSEEQYLEAFKVISEVWAKESGGRNLFPFYFKCFFFFNRIFL